MAPQSNSKKRNADDQQSVSCTQLRPSKKQKVSVTPTVNPMSKSSPKLLNSPKKREIIEITDDEPAQLLFPNAVHRSIVSKLQRRPTGTYPRFNDGHVYIELQRLNKTYSYRLHRGILGSNSLWFREALDMPWNDLSNEIAHRNMRTLGPSSRFELFMDLGLGIEILKRVNLTTYSDDNFQQISAQAKISKPKKESLLCTAKNAIEPSDGLTPMDRKNFQTLQASASESYTSAITRDRLEDAKTKNPRGPDTECEVGQLSGRGGHQMETKYNMMVATKAQFNPSDIRNEPHTCDSVTNQSMSEVCKAQANSEISHVTATMPQEKEAVIKSNTENLKVDDLNLLASQPDAKTDTSTLTSNTLETKGIRLDPQIEMNSFDTTFAPLQGPVAALKKEVKDVSSTVLKCLSIEVDPEVEDKDNEVGLVGRDNLHARTENERVESTDSTMQNATARMEKEHSAIHPELAEAVMIELGLETELRSSETALIDHDIMKQVMIDQNHERSISMIQDVTTDNDTESFSFRLPEIMHAQASTMIEAAEMTVDARNEHLSTPANSALIGDGELIGSKPQFGTSCAGNQADGETVFKTSTNAENKTPRSRKIETRGQRYSMDEQAGKVPIANPQKDILEAYNSLFSIYYNKAPTISTTDINVALDQIELLIRVAEVCQSIAFIVPHIESALFRFGAKLPQAIFSDPPRWMMLALTIRSAPIYRSAILHIAGSYQLWPPSSILTDDDLPCRVIQFIERAQNQAQLLRSEVDRKLYCNNLTKLAKDVPEDGKSNLNAWFTMQLWRDWFSKAMACASEVMKLDGNLYRLLAQGGEAYLPLGTVMAELAANDLFGKVDMIELNNNLTRLKKQAQAMVAPICVNKSGLSVEENCIRYLTCIDVADNDLPWILLPEEFAQNW